MIVALTNGTCGDGKIAMGRKAISFTSKCCSARTKPYGKI